MSVFDPNSCHLREVLIFCFRLKKTVAETHQMLSSTYGDSLLSERTCREWFQRFTSGDFYVEDRHDGGTKNIFEDLELEALLAEDTCQTDIELTESLEVDLTSYFETPQNHGNDLEARELGSVRVEAERC